MRYLLIVAMLAGAFVSGIYYEKWAQSGDVFRIHKNGTITSVGEITVTTLDNAAIKRFRDVLEKAGAGR